MHIPLLVNSSHKALLHVIELTLTQSLDGTCVLQLSPKDKIFLARDAKRLQYGFCVETVRLACSNRLET